MFNVKFNNSCIKNLWERKTEYIKKTYVKIKRKRDKCEFEIKEKNQNNGDKFYNAPRSTVNYKIKPLH